MLASLAWTAWAEAGAPELQGFTGGCSRAVPDREIILKGFPVPGGFTHPDGGSVEMPDASVVTDGGPPTADGGCIDGTCPSDAGSTGGGGEEPLPTPCGCTAAPGLMGLALVWALIRRRKR